MPTAEQMHEAVRGNRIGAKRCGAVETSRWLSSKLGNRDIASW